MTSIAALATASSFFTQTAAFITIGLLLAMTFLLFDVNGNLEDEALKLRKVAFISALLWGGFSLVTIVTIVAKILDSSFTTALDGVVLRSFLTQVTLGKFWLFQVIAAFAIAAISAQIKKITPALFTLALAIAAVVAPVFQSHSAASGSHALAIGSLVIHVAALSLWVGGIFALMFISAERRSSATVRFSALALWCASAVVLSGSANAFARLNFLSAWSSAYARVVIIKIVLTIALIYIGARHRKNIVSHSIISKALLARLLSVEAGLMVLLLALGSWLSQQQPPVRDANPQFNAALEITGISMPAKPNFSRLFWSYDMDALMLGLLVLAALLYFKAVRVLSDRGDKWPIGRTIAFIFGLAAIDFATSGGLGVYAKFSFSYHMIAHMVLGMIAPIGLILGAPITLALRTLPQGRGGHERGVRGTLVSILHSKLFGFYANPVVALAIFDGSLFALYLTPLFGDLMQSHTGHLFMNIHFILAGALFFHVIIGVDPNPKKIPHLARIVTLFAAMSIHAFFSVALMSSSTLIDGGYYALLNRPWATDLLSDQKVGAAIGWAMGEIPIVVALIATFIQWMRSDAREASRADKRSAVDLAEYNEYLQKLSSREDK